MWCVPGGVLLSRSLAGAVPSALGVLASGFGMDAGRGTPAMTAGTSMCPRRPACGGGACCGGPSVPPLGGWGLVVDRIVGALVVCVSGSRPPGVPGWVGVLFVSAD